MFLAELAARQANVHAMVIRAARPDEAAALTALAMRSKRSWGYDEAFMQRALPDMIVTPEDIARSYCRIAELDSKVCGYVLSLSLDAESVLLRDLFVEPEYFGRGIGTALFHRALRHAQARGAQRLTLEADPNSQAFYERFGMRCVGRAASIAGNGRTLPILEVSLERS